MSAANTSSACWPCATCNHGLLLMDCAMLCTWPMPLLLLLLALQLQFSRGVHGKPYLKLASAAAADQGLGAQLQFNLAHTQSVIGRFTEPAHCLASACTSLNHLPHTCVLLPGAGLRLLLSGCCAVGGHICLAITHSPQALFAPRIASGSSTHPAGESPTWAVFFRLQGVR